MTNPETIIPSPSQRTPQCPRCGFAVSTTGELCAACQDKENARPPTPMWQIRPPGVTTPVAGDVPRDGGPEVDPDEEED